MYNFKDPSETCISKEIRINLAKLSVPAVGLISNTLLIMA